MEQRRILSSFYLFASYFLIVIPFILIFNDILTNIALRFYLYRYLQEILTPLEIQITGFVVRMFGIDYTGLKESVIVGSREIYFNWNCLGWQSLILYIGSILLGFQGKYTFWSKALTFFLGLFGIFWLNILRLSLLLMLYAASSPVYQYIFHNYLAAVLTVLYLFGFWLFAYKHLLDPGEKITDSRE